MSTQTRAREHQRRQQAVAAAAVLAVRRTLSPGSTQAVAQTMARYQALSATMAVQTMAAEAGGSPVVQAAAFAGVSSSGIPIEDLLAPLVRAFTREALRSSPRIRLGGPQYAIERFVASEVQDAGRTAAQTQIYAGDDRTKYARILTPPSCPRCTILAGRIYSDSEAFDRHPFCDCVHWPVDELEQAKREGLVVDARTAVGAGKVTRLSQADTRAILEGADPTQVVNATRGLRAPGLTAARTADVFGRTLKITTDGTTRTSAWRKANPDRPFRLRPEAIFQIATDREDAMRLLKVYSYIT